MIINMETLHKLLQHHWKHTGVWNKDREQIGPKIYTGVSFIYIHTIEFVFFAQIKNRFGFCKYSLGDARC